MPTRRRTPSACRVPRRAHVEQSRRQQIDSDLAGRGKDGWRELLCHRRHPTTPDVQDESEIANRPPAFEQGATLRSPLGEDRGIPGVRGAPAFDVLVPEHVLVDAVETLAFRHQCRGRPRSRRARSGPLARARTSTQRRPSTTARAPGTSSGRRVRYSVWSACTIAASTRLAEVGTGRSRARPARRRCRAGRARAACASASSASTSGEHAARTPSPSPRRGSRRRGRRPGARRATHRAPRRAASTA